MTGTLKATRTGAADDPEPFVNEAEREINGTVRAGPSLGGGS